MRGEWGCSIRAHADERWGGACAKEMDGGGHEGKDGQPASLCNWTGLGLGGVGGRGARDQSPSRGLAAVPGRMEM